MTTVKFLNGSRDILGNIVEIHTKTSRVIVDFGMMGRYKKDRVDSLLKSQILPDLPDLFTKKSSKYQQQAIVLTHFGMENLNAALYLQSDIKIYVPAYGLKLYQTLVENDLIQPLDAQLLELPDKLTIGDLTVKGFASDSDVFGVQSLLISDGPHNFGVSGDVRVNGPHRDEVYKWIRKFHKKELELFLFDATSYSFSKHCQLFAVDEYTLRKQFADLVVQRRDLMVINLDIFNVDRVVRLVKKAHHLDRKMVLEEAFAKVVKELFPDLKLIVLAESRANKKAVSNDFEIVSLKDIKQTPKKYVLQNSFGNISFLKKLPSGLYLHSNGFPEISSDRDYDCLRDVLKKHAFQYIDFSASGHANKQDLVFLVDAVKAKKTVPWHSYHPELAISAMKDLPTKFVLPKLDKKLYFK